MNIAVKIILTGIIGFAAFSLLSSFTIDNTANFLKTNDLAPDQVPTLDTWSGRFLILGVGTILAFLTMIAPIPGEIKAVALLLELLGGVIAWILV